MIQIISFVKQESASFGQWFGGSSSIVYRYAQTYHRYQYVSQTSRWTKLLLHKGYALCMWCRGDSVPWRHVLMRDMNKLHANCGASRWTLIDSAFQRGSSLHLQLFNLLMMLILVNFGAGCISIRNFCKPISPPPKSN